MLIKKQIEVKITKRNQPHYLEKGYTSPIGEKILISNIDLTKGSEEIVEVSCDFCGKITPKKYEQYHRQHFNKNNTLFLDSCSDCSPMKSKALAEANDNVNPAWSEEARKKREETNIKKYGSSTPLSNKEVRNKIEKTNLEKYGNKNPLKNNEVKEKIEKTNVEKYGYKNPFSNKEIQEKIKKSNLETYGYEYITQNEEEMKRRTIKRNKTMRENNLAPTSRQQQYIYDVVGGVLNLPVDTCFLDIAFPDELIYIEYQGSGHNLSVKLGKETEESFKRKEINRYYYLKNIGWKMIEVVSKKDVLPNEKELSLIVGFAKNYIRETNSSYIGLYLDDNKIKIKNEFFDYIFNKDINSYELKKIYTSKSGH